MKGHWPKGKRRNRDRGDWAHVRLSLASLLRNHHRPGVISASVLARTLGVYAKTVTRWLDGTNRPPPEVQEKVSTWVAEKSASVRRERT